MRREPLRKQSILHGLLPINPIPMGNRVGMVTTGGGFGVITSDFCEEEGLSVPPLSSEIVSEIDKILPDYLESSKPNRYRLFH